MRGPNWQENDGSLNTGKYCPSNIHSDFRISGPRPRISHGHIPGSYDNVQNVMGLEYDSQPESHADSLPREQNRDHRVITLHICSPKVATK